MDPGYDYISLDKLRIGLYVELQLGWMSRSVSKGQFQDQQPARQIDTLRSLGLDRIRCIPARSDPAPLVDADMRRKLTKQLTPCRASVPGPWWRTPDPPPPADENQNNCAGANMPR